MKAERLFKRLGYECIKGHNRIKFKKNVRQWRERGQIEITFDFDMQNVSISFNGDDSGYLPTFLDIEETYTIQCAMEEYGFKNE